jgi:F-type H+-transporting ATPase subunit alpha
MGKNLQRNDILMNETIDRKVIDLYRYIDDEVSFPWFKDRLRDAFEPEKTILPDTQTLNSEIQQILDLLAVQSDAYENKVSIKAVGTVQHIGNGVANISGLPQAGINEMVNFSTGIQGLILNLDADSIDVILLGPEEGIHGGDMVTSSREKITVPVGPDVIGRVLNALGQPQDDLPPISAVDFHNIDIIAPGIIERAPVNEPLHTGIKIIDALFPIGRGQRELIIGDRQTGKTSLAMDTILSQKHSNVYCIYVAIGQKKSSVLSVMDTLQQHDAFKYTSVITSNPDDPPALRYLAPFTGCTMAEYFLNQGQDVLIIYDDLSKHADAYRELSLLLRRPPGREAYPGDIFYLHSRLLERSCKLNEINGGGSLTALPIMTMQQGNISAYIPTNLISICDGQIVLSTDKFNRGFKPAIHIGLSVSRVGGAAQTTAMRTVSNELKLDLSQYEEVERFTQFGTEVDETTKKQIRRGQMLQNLLNQAENHPLPLAEQVVIFYAANKGYLDHVDLDQVEEFENMLINWIHKNHSGIFNDISRERKLIPEIERHLKTILIDFENLWKSGVKHNG